MKIDTTRISLATQMAGAIPAGAEVAGLIINSNDARDYSALVRMRTGIYVSMIAQSSRSIDQDRAKAALAAAALGRRGGRKTSPAKTKAVRENAKKGGRPPARSGYAIVWDDRGTMKIHGWPDDATIEEPATTTLYETEAAAQAEIDEKEWHNCRVITVTRLTPKRIDYEPIKRPNYHFPCDNSP